MITLQLAQAGLVLECRALTGCERLGAPNWFELLAFAPEAIPVRDVLGNSAALIFDSMASTRMVVGVVTAFGRVATTHQGAGRRYRVVLESNLSWGRHRRDSVVFQECTAEAMIRTVLARTGWADENIKFQSHSLPKRRYVVQYDETCENFVHRLCEREGLGYFLAAEDGKETINFFADSGKLEALAQPIFVTDDSEQQTGGWFGWSVERKRRRRPGAIRLRDYHPFSSTPLVEATTTAGGELEASTEVYRAPGGFATDGEGKESARIALERLRGDSDVVRFKTNTLELAPGIRFELMPAPEFPEGEECAGQYVVHSVEHEYEHERQRSTFAVTAIPVALPWRRMGMATAPRIYGLQSAVITGAEQEEIHPDDKGSVFIRYFWNREGPTDHLSSLPVRVAQPNTPGSMAIPRVGWEVYVTHENGDPDRPLVVGRAYNAKGPPPFALPANKTVTSIRSPSSPGGKTMNSIHMDDAAGRQHVHIFAGFGKATTVAHDMKTQTGAVEEKIVKGNQSMTIGSNEKVSVTQLFAIQAKTQSTMVGGFQSTYVQGSFTIKTGSEMVLVGAALLEKVGNPVAGLKALGASAAMAVAGAVGGIAGGAIGGTVGGALGGIVAGAAAAGGVAAAKGENVMDAVVGSVADGAIGQIPGLSAVASAVNSFGVKFPWQPPDPPAGKAADGGGAGAAKSDSAGAKGPGPGHRKEKIVGAWLEMVDGPLSITSPGAVKWETVGAGTILVGGSHTVRTLNYSAKTAGVCKENLGSLKVNATAGDANFKVMLGISRDITGQFTVKAGGKFVMDSKSSITLKAASLDLKGSHVSFIVGSSVVSLSSGGVLIKAAKIDIKGHTNQKSASTGHPP